jgi:glycogen phosphorylase
VDWVDGNLKFTHINYDPVMAVPYDIPIAGYENNVVNTLRLWSAEPVDNGFDFSSFSRGDYMKAMEYKNSVAAISQVLYPDDSFYEGKKLRLKQQYFFVSAGLQSIIRHLKMHKTNIKNLDEKIAIHINDTHPVLAIPELMRILMDEEGLGWDDAWRITSNTVSYTNHTILAEALEKWPVDMFKGLLPRIYMIVEEINRRFCEELWSKYIGQWDKISAMAIIGDGYVRMAHLAIAASHSVNGVAKLHTEILKKQEMSNFYYLYPHKFNNKTNGITHRRWLLKSNPGLTKLLQETIGQSFIKHPIDMINFEKYANDKAVQEKLFSIKRNNKEKLAKFIKESQGIDINPDSMFDVHVKRIHAYKRQSLNCLRIMELYNRLLENPNLDIVPRTFIFAGKAAPGYYLAKKTIELINAVADKVNNDKRIKDKIKVVFMENYRVSLAETIIPAAELSEQISTTTKEASGTSNMKFMMNGAITIATLDGANIEIRDEVGDDNIIIFGLTEREVLDYYRYGGYSSWNICQNDERLKKITGDLVNGFYSPEKERFKSVYDNLITYNDEFFVFKDFDSYLKAQERVDSIYRNFSKWQSMSIVNIAHSGVFSSDRTIEEYATGIWGSGYLYKNL